MITSHFSNIRFNILSELAKAESSVKVASAYFTDNELFRELVYLSNRGIKVELIISDENINIHNEEINYMEIIDSGGELYIANRTPVHTILHHKFCIIDNKKIITGSYNWTKKAEKNLENIVIIEHKKTIERFTIEFNQIKKNFTSIVEDWNNKPIYSGFLHLDQTIGGFLPNELICLSGSRIMGKTDFLLSMFTKMSDLGTSIGYINSHTPIQQIALDWIVKESNIPIKKIRTGSLNSKEEDIIKKTAETVNKRNIFISDEIDTLKNLIKRCKILRINKGVQIIVIDKIDHLLSKTPFNNEQSYDVFKKLKNLARYLRIPIIIVEESNISYPRGIPSLQKSSFISEYADVIMLIHRDECLDILEDEEGNSLKGIAKVIITKHTIGNTGTVLLKYDEDLQQFKSFE